MEVEYDFSKAERGKFFREGARFDLPVYLEEDVRGYLEERARAKGTDLGSLVNALLKRDIELIESVK